MADDANKTEGKDEGAKENGGSATASRGGAKAKTTNELDKAAVAKKLKAEVLVLKLGKDGKPTKTEGGKLATERRAVKEEDILSFRQDGDTIHVVTVDGQKHEVAA